MPRLLFNRNSSGDPLQEWPKSSIIDQCMEASSFLKPNDRSWLNTAKKTLETSSWSGFLSFPLVTPVCPEVSSSSDGRFSPVECESKTWGISLDVSHFCPEDLVVKINDSYLEIAGKHKERHNDHGTIFRSFTRKYKLPENVDLQKMSSSLSSEGILLVEAPFGISSERCPTETVIPIQTKENPLGF